MLLGWDANGKYFKVLYYMNIPDVVYNFPWNLSDRKRIRLALCSLAMIIIDDLGFLEYMM